MVEGGGDVRANPSSNDSTPPITLKASSGSAIKDFEGLDDLEIVNHKLQPIHSIGSPLGEDATLPDGNSVSRNSSSDAIGVVDHSVVVNIPPDANVGEKEPLTLNSGEATKVLGDHLLTNEHVFAPWYKYACADVLLSLEPEGSSSDGTKSTLHRWENFWDNGSTITYAFMKGSLIQQRKVVAVLDQWRRYANIKFEHRESLNEATIRISFEERFGSFSYIGRTIESIPRDRATMNLGWLEDTLLFTDVERAVLLHEIGHTLGLSHEHASPALGGQGTLKQEAYENYNNYVIGGADEALVAGAFNAYANFELSNYLETDAGSIMKYFMPQEMNEESVQFLPNYGLSDMDLAFIMIIYPFPAGSTPVKDGWNLDHALWIAGVDGEIKELILEEYARSNWPEMRFQFINYYTEARAARSFHGVTDDQHLPSESVELDWHLPSEGVELSWHPPSEGVELDWCCAEDAFTGDEANDTVAAFDENLWLPGDVITYSFVQGLKDATPYRQRRVAETYAYYSSITNLRFRKIPFDMLAPAKADIHIYFGPIPNGRSSGWSMIGTTCQGSRQSQALIHERGGTVESSMCFTDMIARTETSIGDKVQEERILFHEIAHSLGLRHERLSTVTTDTHHHSESVVVPFDLNSIMLYADRSLETTKNWKNFKEFFNFRSRSFNHLPSVMDEAVLGVLYPYPDGDVFDHFEGDLRSLGLQSNLGKLSAQRDRAFSFSGRLDFAVEIGQLRRMIYDALANLAANPPSSSFLLTPSITSAAIGQTFHTPSPSINKPLFKVMGVRTQPKTTTGPFLKTILDELTKLFAPNSGQVFALQIPGRCLSQDQYAWDTTAAGIHGQSIKPAAVTESEFRLTDQLYNVGNVVSTPNGLNLSLVYEQCLNNLVPSPQQTSITRQQDQVRKWLMTDVPITGWVKDLVRSQRTQPNSDAAVSPETSAPRAISAPSATSPEKSLKPTFPVLNKLTEEGKINRMELADALMIEYLTAKQAWEAERDELILALKSDNTDAATRHLNHVTAIREGQLASKYADAVVRGHSHTVRQYLGYLDIKSAAELLQDAKDALRNSASSSLDGSMTIYPVQFQPIDWFQGLYTNFTVEDLFMNPDLIAQALDAKSKQLDILNTQLVYLQRSPSSGHDFEESQGTIDVAQSMYDQAQVEFYTTYTNNVTSLAKTCINASGEFVMDEFVKLAKASGISEAAFLNIEQAMAKITSAQLAIVQVSRAYTHVFSAKSLAQAAETANETIRITADIIALTREVDELTSYLRVLRFGNAKATTATDSLKFASVDDVDLIPKEITSSPSRWQEVTITHTIDNPFSSESKFDSSKEDCSFFHKPESFSASGKDSPLSNISSVTVEVGFRCTLVTVDRGRWFQPQFFKQSNSFCHVDEKVSWSKWPQDFKTTDNLIAQGLHGAFDDINKYLMPAFPTGFLIAKDITIKVLQTSAEVRSSAVAFEKAVASSADILCWSTSSPHDQSSGKTYAYAQADDGYVIRIPGPQIMGYMLQFTDPDMTKPIPDEDFLSSDDQ